MKIKLNLILLFVFILSVQINAQKDGHVHGEKCGTDHYTQELMKDPAYAKEYKQLREAVKVRLANKSMTPCTTPLIVPVAVHYNTPITNANLACLVSAAQAQVDQLNLDYSSCNANVADWCNFLSSCPSYFTDPNGGDVMPEAGSCIQFCLADQNLPAGEDNINGFGITLGDYSWLNWPGATWAGYVNIFVSDGPTAGQASNGLGIAPLNGAANPNGNGFWVRNDLFGAATFAGCTSGGTIGDNVTFGNGATVTHEAGHYFGLDHTFSDALADTPPQTVDNQGCPVLDLVNCTTSVGNDFSFNFMDYVDDDCMSNFSADQATVQMTIAAAQSAWATNSISCYDDWVNGTLAYNACQGECTVSNPPVAAFTPLNNANIDLCTVGPVSYSDTSTGTPNAWSWTFVVSSGNLVLDIASSTSQNPTVNITAGTSGVIQTTLMASNSGGSNSITQNANVNIITCPQVCNTANLAIPDNNPAGASSVIAQASGGTVTDVNVEVDITHTYVGDLTVTLEHLGTTVVLIDRPGVPASGFGCNGDNIVDCILDDQSANGTVEDVCNNNPAITGTYNPMQALSVFNGANLAGDWVLNVSDSEGGDTGTLDEWCLTITTSSGMVVCLSMAQLSGTINSIEDYESSDYIETTQILQAGAQVDYDAAQSILLGSNFECQLGAVFEAFIDGCNNGNGGVNAKESNVSEEKK